MRYVSSFFALVSVLIVPVPADAHAFGQRYDLPLPLWMFITGGAVAVFLSFVIMVLFMRHKPSAGDYPTINLLSNPLTRPLARLLANKISVEIVRIIFAIWFFLIIATGFWGNPNPLKNISIVMVWVIAWVGLAFICSLIGNFWALINPWNTIYSWAEKGYQIVTSKELSRRLVYPRGWGTLPALIFLLTYSWLEMDWPGASRPFSVASALTIYSGITFLGMFLYGREIWLRHGEAFSVLFALFARFAVTEVRVIDQIAAKNCVIYDFKDNIRCINGYGAFFKTQHEGREWNLRPPGVGLMTGYEECTKENTLPSYTLMLFVLLALAMVTYDGFSETATFKELSFQLFEKAHAITNNRFSPSIVSLIGFLGLVSFPILFTLVYLLFATLIAVASGTLSQFGKLARLFVFSIMPIAIAYHLSHYISLLVIQGQLLIPGISDPFGYGWDLFGTASYQINITVINAKFVWYFSLIVIVIGHITAVYLAHAEALMHIVDRDRALFGQIPMLALMIGYTMLSLWLIAEPIVE